MRKVEGYNIFIGNLKDAKDEALIRLSNIKVIMNACNDIETVYYSDIHSMKFGLDDPKETLAPNNMPETAALVFSLGKAIATARGGGILIYCAAGHNRSALVAALYLRFFHNIPLEDAVKLTQVGENKNWMKDKGYNW